MQGSADRDADFAEFVAARRDRLLRTAYLLCGDAHRAEDIVQVALTKLYVAWPRVRRADSVDAYVRRTLVNTHLTETRRPWRRERTTLESACDPVAPGAGPEGAGSHVDLWAALGRLTLSQRRVVVLRHYWGLSLEETAADLGVSVGTVKSQTHAALARLRTALADTSGRTDTPRARSNR